MQRSDSSKCAVGWIQLCFYRLNLLHVHVCQCWEWFGPSRNDETHQTSLNSWTTGVTDWVYHCSRNVLWGSPRASVHLWNAAGPGLGCVQSVLVSQSTKAWRILKVKAQPRLYSSDSSHRAKLLCSGRLVMQQLCLEVRETQLSEYGLVMS